jgi:prepilin-type processing-associated H-X9-DG protein
MAQKKMAVSQQIREHLLGEEHFWTITKNVGYGYQNLDSDVRLIQFLLNASYNNFNYLRVDGKFGGKTWNAIKQFQSDMRAIPDGMISPVGGENLRGSKTKRIYTIFDLNLYYRHKFPQYYKDISKDPNLDPGLRSHFTVSDDIFQDGASLSRHPGGVNLALGDGSVRF